MRQLTRERVLQSGADRGLVLSKCKRLLARALDEPIFILLKSCLQLANAQLGNILRKHHRRRTRCDCNNNNRGNSNN